MAATLTTHLLATAAMWASYDGKDYPVKEKSRLISP